MALALAMLLLAHPAHGGLAQRAGDCLARELKPWVIPWATRNLENQSIELTVKGKKVRFELGDRLGAGWLGAVYRVKSVSDRAALGAARDQPLGEIVLKFPHSTPLVPIQSRWLSMSFKNRGELELYQQARREFAQIRASPYFPGNHAWGDGIPVVPILDAIETREAGVVLIKPLLKGKPLGKIAVAHGDRLPPEMEAAVGDVYDLTQSILDRLRVWGGRRAFSPDIRPENFVWIEDPADLARFGYTKPGMILYEIDAVPFHLQQYHATKTSFPEFLEEFRTYLRKAGGRTVATARAPDAPGIARLERWLADPTGAPPRAATRGTLEVVGMNGTQRVSGAIRVVPLGKDGHLLAVEDDLGRMNLVDPRIAPTAIRAEDSASTPDRALRVLDAENIRTSVCRNWRAIRERGDFPVIEDVAKQLKIDFPGLGRFKSAPLYACMGSAGALGSWTGFYYAERGHDIDLMSGWFDQHLASSFVQGLGFMAVANACLSALDPLAYFAPWKIGVVGAQIAGSIYFEASPFNWDPGDLSAGLGAAALYWALASWVESQGWVTWAALCG